MTIGKKIIDKKRNELSHDQLICPECESEDLTTVNGEYTCRNCGLVLDTKVAVYNSPYEKEHEHYHRYNRYSQTQIGTARERFSINQGQKYRKLQKINKSKTYTENKECQTKFEINRIFTLLKLPHRLRRAVFLKYKEIWEQLEAGTKFRSYQKLLPPLIYLIHKSAGCPINQKELIEYSDIEKSDFREGILLIHQLLPQLSKRNRGKYIVRKISQVTSQLGLDMDFYKLSGHILKSFWSDLYNTSDNVIAGVVMSIATLTAYQDQTNVNRICDHLNIAMSTIQSQVQRKIVRKLDLSGFTSLVKSSFLLKKVLIKMGLIEGEIKDIEKESDQNVLKTLLTNEDFIKFYQDIDGFRRDWLEFTYTKVNLRHLLPEITIKLFRFEINDVNLWNNTNKLLVLPLRNQYALIILEEGKFLFKMYSKKGPPQS